MRKKLSPKGKTSNVYQIKGKKKGGGRGGYLTTSSQKKTKTPGERQLIAGSRKKRVTQRDRGQDGNRQKSHTGSKKGKAFKTARGKEDAEQAEAQLRLDETDHEIRP